MKTYNNQQFSFKYESFAENRKSLAIHVFPDKSVLLKVPNQASAKEVESFLKRKAVWVFKQIKYFEQFSKKELANCKAGSEVFYLGKQYQLIINRVEKAQAGVVLDKSKIHLNVDKNKQIQDFTLLLKKYLLEHAEKEFALALKRCLKNFPINFVPKLKIRKLSKRWGSYQKELITLNPSLIFTRKKCIEYVIMHELCHVFYKSHNAEFYSLLGSKIPNWKRIKDELESNIYIL